MKVHELIAQLEAKPRNATVYVEFQDAETGVLMVRAVEGICPAQSPAYGSAVIIEIEE
ncbi:MAG: hypothetical protein U0989_02605 [Azonexus sp.]|nr:hypothetical protein [Azonexus sp.]MDP3636984.1 hypothetical protein [Azonexus sp.]MDZ4313657.1 hypothetical protein [Azonexus sp.]